MSSVYKFILSLALKINKLLCKDCLWALSTNPLLCYGCVGRFLLRCTVSCCVHIFESNNYPKTSNLWNGFPDIWPALRSNLWLPDSRLRKKSRQFVAPVFTDLTSCWKKSVETSVKVNKQNEPRNWDQKLCKSAWTCSMVSYAFRHDDSMWVLSFKYVHYNIKLNIWF